MSNDSLNQWDAYAMQDCIKGLTKERDNWKEAYSSTSNALSLLLRKNDELMTKLEQIVEEAYSEGFAEGHVGGWIEGDYSKPWKKSALFTTLAELTGGKDD